MRKLEAEGAFEEEAIRKLIPVSNEGKHAASVQCLLKTHTHTQCSDIAQKQRVSLRVLLFPNLVLIQGTKRRKFWAVRSCKPEQPEGIVYVWSSLCPL